MIAQTSVISDSANLANGFLLNQFFVLVELLSSTLLFCVVNHCLTAVAHANRNLLVAINVVLNVIQEIVHPV